MNKYINGSLSPTLQNEFNFTHEIHNHNTRKSCMSNIAIFIVFWSYIMELFAHRYRKLYLSVQF